MSDQTVPFILDVPVLDDEAVDAVNAFLWDLLVQFESQYFSQLSVIIASSTPCGAIRWSPGRTARPISPILRAMRTSTTRSRSEP